MQITTYRKKYKNILINKILDFRKCQIDIYQYRYYRKKIPLLVLSVPTGTISICINCLNESIPIETNSTRNGIFSVIPVLENIGIFGTPDSNGNNSNPTRAALMHNSHITSNDPSIFATKQNRSKFNVRKQNAHIEFVRGPITTT